MEYFVSKLNFLCLMRKFSRNPVFFFFFLERKKINFGCEQAKLTLKVRYLSLSETNFVCFDGKSFEEKNLSFHVQRFRSSGIKLVQKFFIFKGKFLLFLERGYENGMFFFGFFFCCKLQVFGISEINWRGIIMICVFLIFPLSLMGR